MNDMTHPRNLSQPLINHPAFSQKETKAFNLTYAYHRFESVEEENKARKLFHAGWEAYKTEQSNYLDHAYSIENSPLPSAIPIWVAKANAAA
jgi:hypothetical protein